MKSLLLIEDDTSLGSTLAERLQREGYNVKWVVTLQQANKVILENTFDLIIIDIGLPDGSGLEFATKLKEKVNVPFIFVTAMNSAEHRLRGYEIGADEYIPKPFHLKELLLRISRVLGRTSNVGKILVAGIEIDLNAMSISKPDGTVEYPTSRDFKILRCLINATPSVVSREELIKLVIGDSSEDPPTQRTIDNSIVRLRQLFGEGSQSFIRSVRGVGYQWVGDK